MWILIIAILSIGTGQPSSLMSAEFNTKDACVSAANEWQKRIDKAQDYNKIVLLCTPKG